MARQKASTALHTCTRISSARTRNTAVRRLTSAPRHSSPRQTSSSSPLRSCRLVHRATHLPLFSELAWAEPQTMELTECVSERGYPSSSCCSRVGALPLTHHSLRSCKQVEKIIHQLYCTSVVPTWVPAHGLPCAPEHRVDLESVTVESATDMQP